MEPDAAVRVGPEQMAGIVPVVSRHEVLGERADFARLIVAKLVAGARLKDADRRPYLRNADAFGNGGFGRGPHGDAGRVFTHAVSARDERDRAVSGQKGLCAHFQLPCAFAAAPANHLEKGEVGVPEQGAAEHLVKKGWDDRHMPGLLLQEEPVEMIQIRIGTEDQLHPGAQWNVAAGDGCGHAEQRPKGHPRRMPVEIPRGGQDFKHLVVERVIADHDRLGPARAAAGLTDVEGLSAVLPGQG